MVKVLNPLNPRERHLVLTNFRKEAKKKGRKEGRMLKITKNIDEMSKIVEAQRGQTMLFYSNFCLKLN